MVPLNIVLIIADGTGLDHLGVALNHSPRMLDRFEHSTIVNNTPRGLSRIADSASAATALATGHQVHRGVISQSTRGKRLTTLLEHARSKHYKVGVIVASDVEDATPAAFMAHSRSRHHCRSIRRQITRFKPDVLCGALSSCTALRDYIRAYTSNTFILNPFNKRLKSPVHLNEPTAMFYPHEYVPARERHPSIGTLAKHVIASWEGKHPFVVMVEESNIDVVSHAGDTVGLREECKSLTNTLESIFNTVSDDTLVVLTADHSTGGLQLMDNGVTTFTHHEHNGCFVPLFASGPGADFLTHGATVPQHIIGQRLQGLVDGNAST